MYCPGGEVGGAVEREERGNRRPQAGNANYIMYCPGSNWFSSLGGWKQGEEGEGEEKENMGQSIISEKNINSLDICIVYVN